MTVPNTSADKTPLKLPLPLWEFVSLIAVLMALNALAIDVMLPALSEMSDHFQLADENAQQWVIFAYVLGYGIPQLFFGAITDRFGRKLPTQVCLIGYALTGIGCMMIGSFEGLLALRFIQGLFAAGVRVISVSIVRDMASGRTMARLMSLIMTVFMVIPILAPSLGALIMLKFDWQWIFGALTVAGVATFIWVQLRLPETLPEDQRRGLNVTEFVGAFAEVGKSRVSFGYIAASGVIFGSLIAFIATSEQIFTDIFGMEKTFTLWFAGIAGGLAVANFFNSAIVERLGMRRISHSVLCAFIVLALLSAILMSVFRESLWIFYPLFVLNFACFGMMGANFSALALEPLGKIAGTASAAHGFATTTVATGFGILVASQYNGTVVPLMVGYAALGIASLAIILVTEKGRLFQTR